MRSCSTRRRCRASRPTRTTSARSRSSISSKRTTSAPIGRDDGPYSLTIGQQDAKLSFTVRNEAGETVADFIVSMTPFRPLLKDYFLVCETYYAAIRTASPRQIEAIDRERTALHNEGADLMATRLADKVEIDSPTARRLFTLISALHWKT